MAGSPMYRGGSELPISRTRRPQGGRGRRGRRPQSISAIEASPGLCCSSVRAEVVRQVVGVGDERVGPARAAYAIERASDTLIVDLEGGLVEAEAKR